MHIYHIPILQITINSFAIFNDEFVHIGVGFYIGGSIYNHSCRPNAFATFDNGNLVIRNTIDLPLSYPVSFDSSHGTIVLWDLQLF
jgi:hypothetical protein